jgi:hypothetical protein
MQRLKFSWHISLDLCVLFGTTWIASKKHNPALNLQRSDNLLEESFTFCFSCMLSKTTNHLEYLNPCIEQWIKYLGVKYISGLGAILNAPLYCNHYFFRGEIGWLFWA